MTRELSRNAVAALAVALLHAALILALMSALYRPAGSLSGARLVQAMLTTNVPKNASPALPDWAAPARIFLSPLLPAEPSEPHLDMVSPASSAPSLLGVGRALRACDLNNLSMLPPEERALCLHLKPPHGQPPDVRLGTYDENSPYAKAIAKRNAPAQPTEHPCSVQESPTANLGLPCYDFPSGTVTGLFKGGN